MGEEKTIYESETRRTRGEVIDFLQQLAKWLGDGRIGVDHGDETTIIEIPDEVTLEIEIEDEDAGEGQIKRSLEVELEWTIAAPAADEEE